MQKQIHVAVIQTDKIQSLTDRQMIGL